MVLRLASLLSNLKSRSCILLILVIIIFEKENSACKNVCEVCYKGRFRVLHVIDKRHLRCLCLIIATHSSGWFFLEGRHCSRVNFMHEVIVFLLLVKSNRDMQFDVLVVRD